MKRFKFIFGIFILCLVCSVGSVHAEDNVSAGWQEVDGKYYYYDSILGDYLTGWQDID